ncbi:hypothetical protein CPLU01_04911 [Colletotrichum plurivorum]|uniref:Uncharacterized protein n=1 Tax=Colletotrichum plurivorum TaxID=2175906 RepID=A0A8H6KPA7_9PEZI|nr:hypothetical protein CPLU01_04911 [Colletotrichum plurivorum]
MGGTHKRHKEKQARTKKRNEARARAAASGQNDDEGGPSDTTVPASDPTPQNGHETGADQETDQPSATHGNLVSIPIGDVGLAANGEMQVIGRLTVDGDTGFTSKSWKLARGSFIRAMRNSDYTSLIRNGEAEFTLPRGIRWILDPPALYRLDSCRSLAKSKTQTNAKTTAAKEVEFKRALDYARAQARRRGDPGSEIRRRVTVSHPSSHDTSSSPPTGNVSGKGKKAAIRMTKERASRKGKEFSDSD